MASVYSVEVENRTYALVDDRSAGYRVLIHGVIRDELTGDPCACPVTIGSDDPRMYVKTFPDGLFCLAGDPQHVFPRLDLRDYIVELTFHAPGYRETARRIEIAAGVDFPVAISEPILLRRQTVRLQGRVVDNGLTERHAIADALVRAVDDPGVPSDSAEHVVVLRTPLHFDHGAGASVRQRPLPASGSVFHLTEATAAGSRSVSLDGRAGLALDAILRVGAGARAEYAVIERMAEEPADPSAAGAVMLRCGLAYTYPAGTAVQPVTAGAASAAYALAAAVEAGESLLMLDNNPLATDETIEIADTPERAEYHALGVRTDAEGYYRMDGIGRVWTLFLEVSAAGYHPLEAPVPWTVQYDRPVNVVNFQLSPLSP